MVVHKRIRYFKYMADIIRLARDKKIEDSRKDAILFLDFQDHIVGQQWQVRYYRDESQTEIDTLVAIGVRNFMMMMKL